MKLSLDVIGYGFLASESRSRRISRGEDWLEAWHDVRDGFTEVSKYAQDSGITLAVQTHPEILGDNEETLEMLAEINNPSLKVGLDLPLLESQNPEFIRKALRDFTGNGSVDAVEGLEFGTDILLFSSLEDPTAPWVRRIIAADVGGGFSMDAADMNVDGDMDIISIGWYNPTIWFYENKAKN